MLNVSPFFLPGPVGRLEVKAAEGRNDVKAVTVVICHPHPLYSGTMENKVVTTLFRTFRELGADVVRFNYRGVGNSEGQYAAGFGEAEDLRAVCAWVRTEKPVNKIWLAGFSFGSYVAAQAANEIKASQLLTIAPAVEHFNFDEIDYPKCPWLVIQGTVDEVVPAQLVSAWIDKQKDPPDLIKYPETGHFFHGQLTNLKNTIIKYYQNLL